MGKDIPHLLEVIIRVGHFDTQKIAQLCHTNVHASSLRGEREKGVSGGGGGGRRRMSSCNSRSGGRGMKGGMATTRRSKSRGGSSLLPIMEDHDLP